MRFTKMHGLGNDFLVIDDRRAHAQPWSELAQRWCERRTGIGADGLLLIQSSDRADLGMRLVNADGSEGEMCGNGVRCAALWAEFRGLAGRRATWETLAGLVVTELLGGVPQRPAPAGARQGLVRVDMGPPRFAAAEIPVRLNEGGDPGDLRLGVVVEGVPFELHGAAVGMGNPHLVVSVDGIVGGGQLAAGGLDGLPAAKLGAAVQGLDVFPSGVNVEFVDVVAPHRVRQRTVERGAGETDACGTGACATVVTLRRRGLLAADGEIEVELRGGMLQVDWRDGGPVMMTGPATLVFDGEVTESAGPPG